MTEIKAFIDQWIDEHEAELVEDISRLVAIKSERGPAEPGAPFGTGPAKAIQEAEKMCQEYGFTTKNYENYVLTANLNENETILDILGHLDVVDAGDGWNTDPYLAVRIGDHLFGRGTDDDKGPVVAALTAMRAIRASGVPLKYNCRLIMGSDEESGSQDLDYYFQRETSAPNTFTPDASFPVFNTEKGHFHGQFRCEWPTVTASPRVRSAGGGYRFNVIPAEAWADIVGLSENAIQQYVAEDACRIGVSAETETLDDGAVRLKIIGRSAHAAEPENGNNGITALFSLLSLLPLADSPSEKAIRNISKLIPHGDYNGKALGISMDDEISGPLTLAWTVFSFGENGLEGFFDSRVPLCATEENCLKKAEKSMQAVGFCFQGGMSAAHHTPADSPFVQTLLSAYQTFTGEKGSCLSMGGGTYVHNIEGGVAFGAGMPGFESNLHGANEHISICNMLTAAKIFALVIVEMCG